MITRIVDKPGSARVVLENGEAIAEVTQTIQCNSARDSEQTIVRSGRVPRENQRFRNGWCQSSEVQRVDGTVWENVVRYKLSPTFAPPSKPPESPNTNNPNDPSNPLNQPTEIRWSSKRLEKYTGKDADGKAILNSAGEPLQDAPPLEIYHAVVTLTRTEHSYEPGKLGFYAGTVNLKKWFLCNPGTAKAEWPEATLINDGNGNPIGWRVSYSFEIAPEGWNPIKIPDRGHFVKKEVSPGEEGNYTLGKTQKLTASDANGVATGELIFLDGKGQALPQKRIDARNPVLLSFNMYQYTDFNQLGLP